MAQPEITIEPSNVLLPAEQTATFSAMVTGEELALEWRRNGLEIIPDPPRIDGIDSATFTIMSISMADEGNYRLTVVNDAGTIMSDTVTLTIRKCEVLPV